MKPAEAALRHKEKAVAGCAFAHPSPNRILEAFVGAHETPPIPSPHRWLDRLTANGKIPANAAALAASNCVENCARDSGITIPAGARRENQNCSEPDLRGLRCGFF